LNSQDFDIFIDIDFDHILNYLLHGY